MLIQIEDDAGKQVAQTALEQAIKTRLPSHGVRNIGFPGGNMNEEIFAEGEGGLWAAFHDAEDAKIARRWNGFGVYQPARNAQIITVEINIPIESNTAQVSGFFARDPSLDATYLMHDGGVGGGMKGVGKTEFLAWTGSKLFNVERSSGRSREGVIIGRVDSPDLPDRILNYVRMVQAFKQAVRDGALTDEAMRARIVEWERYRAENAGRRQGRRNAEIDYVSYHGDVVDLLQKERAGRIEGEIVANSPLIDLLVRTDGRLTEIYEVKTSLSRQSLYTAIGQLMTHSATAMSGVKRILVIPEGDLPADLALCFDTLGIALRRYRLTGTKTKHVALI